MKRKIIDRYLSFFLFSMSIALVLLASKAVGSAAAETNTISFSTRTHTVQWGETLAKIAAKYYNDLGLYVFLADINKIANPDLIICGESIIIPPNPGKKTETGDKSPAFSISQVNISTQTAAVETDIDKQVVSVYEVHIATSTVANGTEDIIIDTVTVITPSFAWRKEPQSVFEIGEKLTFAIRWKFIVVGYATMGIDKIDEVNGRNAYHILTTARSAPFFDNFYRVRDTNESWMDTESLCSVKFASHIMQKNAVKNETLELDQERRRFLLVESGKTGAIPLWVQDVLSSLYYLRTKNLSEGNQFTFDAHSGDKSWPLKVSVLKREKVRVPAGEFDCVVVEPFLREGAGIFPAKGRLRVWLTADEKKVPVLMRSKIAIGSIDAELTEMILK